MNRLVQACRNFVSATNAHLILAAGGDTAPDRFLLLQDGDIGWAGVDGVSLDAETAKALIATFEEHGSKIPIDYHHATEKVDPAQGGKAPAAGHIGKLEYVKGEGLFAADVEWTAEGKSDVESRAFIYTSPAVLAKEQADGKKEIVRISSVALTNQPRTIDAKELLEAAEMVAGEQPMDKFAALKERMSKLSKGLLITAQDDVEGVPEFPAVDADMKAVADLMTTLRGLGVEVAEDASLATVIGLAIEQLAEKEPEETPQETPEAPAEPTAAEAAEKVKAAQFDSLAAENKKLAERLDARDKSDKAAHVETLVKAEVEANRLNPNDKHAMEQAKKYADKDPEGFVKLFATIPAQAPVRPTNAPLSSSAPGNDRKSVISKAFAEYNTSGMNETSFTAEEFVNGELGASNMTLLAEEERKALV